MPAPLLLIPLGIKALCWCGTVIGVGYVCKKGHDAYKHGQKTKQKKYELKGKTIGQAQEDNKKAQAETAEWKQKYEENDTRIKDLEKKSEEASNKSKDTNLSEEERIVWKNKAEHFKDEANSLRTSNKSILDKLKGLENRIKNNNKIIVGTSSNLDERHWVWEFITLENMLILGACYVMYRLIREEKSN
ncbi:MAG: Ribonuclease Y [Mycoplasmataceae bacterium]|nr:MAG: Ribonuclease Y [Mycoplasmataceae bacterium]